MSDLAEGYDNAADEYRDLMKPFLERMVQEMVANHYKGGGLKLREAEPPQLVGDIFYHTLKLAWVIAKLPDDKARIAEYCADVANCAYITAEHFKVCGIESDEPLLLGQGATEEFQKAREELETWLTQNLGWETDEIFLGRSEANGKP